jgi:hypothetical protein
VSFSLPADDHIASPKDRDLSSVQFLSFPPADYDQEVIAIGRIGDQNNQRLQVCAEVLLAPAGWEHMTGIEEVPVQIATVAVGNLPAMQPHSTWRDGQLVAQPDRSVCAVGEVSWHPAQATAQKLSKLPDTVSFSEIDDHPDLSGGAMPAHPIGNLAGMPLFKILIDGRTAYVPVLELMRSAFMPDTFWARYALENRWQSTKLAETAFGNIWQTASPTGPIAEVEAFEHFRRHSAQPLALFGWQPQCLTSLKRLGGNLQSDIYIRRPAFARTLFPFPVPTVWEYRSVRAAVRRPGQQRAIEVEIVTRIFSIHCQHGIQAIRLHVPKTVMEGSKPSRRPAEKPDEETIFIKIEDDAPPSVCRAAQNIVVDDTQMASAIPVERVASSLTTKERTVPLARVAGAPAQFGSTADHAGSDTKVAQVHFSEVMEEGTDPVPYIKATLKDAVEAAGGELGMRFAVVRGPEPDGGWLFPIASGTKWNLTKVDARGRTTRRGFEVLMLVGQRWRVYFFDSVLTAYEKDQGNYARAAGLLRTEAATAFDHTTMKAIAQAWSDANGTWVTKDMKKFFNDQGIAPVGKVSHRRKFEDQVETIVAKVQGLLGE